MTYLILIIIFLIPIFGHLSVKLSQRYYWFECIAVILVMGLRNYVGGDTMGYMTKYEYASPIYELTVMDFVLGEYQPLWVVLQSTCKAISEEFFVLQLVISAAVNIVVFWVMQKYSTNKFFAVFLYLVAQMLNFNCEILRAVLAISIFLIAYEQLVVKHYIYYYILVILAILFHDQAVFLLLVPLFYPYLKKPLSPVILVALLFIGLILSLPPVMSLYVEYLPGERGETFAAGYGSMERASLLGTLRAFVSIFLLYFVTRSRVVCQNERLMPALNLYFCCTVLGVGMPIFSTRVSQFFVIYYLCALSVFFLQSPKGLIKTLVCVMWVFGIFRYYSHDVTSWVQSNSESAVKKYYFYECFYPYYSIWEEPDQIVLTRRKEIADQEMLKIK